MSESIAGKETSVIGEKSNASISLVEYDQWDCSACSQANVFRSPLTVIVTVANHSIVVIVLIVIFAHAFAIFEKGRSEMLVLVTS